MLWGFEFSAQNLVKLVHHGVGTELDCYGPENYGADCDHIVILSTHPKVSEQIDVYDRGDRVVLGSQERVADDDGRVVDEQIDRAQVQLHLDR